MIKQFLLAGLVACLLLGISSVQANPSQKLGSCMVDSLDGKERKKLATWIFFGMAAHPEIESYSKITKTDRVETDKYIGGLISRLLTKDCKAQAEEAMKEGSAAIENSFRVVGEIAMVELMNSQKVSAALGSYSQYLDISELIEN